MNIIRSITSFVLVFVTLALGACSTTTTLRDGTVVDINGVFNLHHASSLVTQWSPTGQKDEKGEPIYVQKKVEKVLGVGPNGPIIYLSPSSETINGPAIGAQATTAVLGGTGAALIQKRAAENVAERQCKDNCGPTFNVQGGSALAGTDTKVNVDLRAKIGTGSASCKKEEGGCPGN